MNSRFFLLHAAVVAGALAGLVGILHASKMRNANPFDLAGIELTVIAAAVLGGTSISGGRGSVLGVILGVALLVVLANSLILLGLPSQWHQVATGLIIIISTGITAWRNRTSLVKGELA
jgi:simple sugar transport system permease protein